MVISPSTTRLGDSVRNCAASAWATIAVTWWVTTSGSVSVGHEGLLLAERFLGQLPSTTGGLHPSHTFTPCRHTNSTNLPGQYT